ncbi:MAG: type III pantothenate kinase [Gammaproteobacteria bacterium]
MSRRVLLDAGNSSVKWVCIERERWEAQGRCNYDDLTALHRQLTPETACFVASVAHPRDVGRVRALLQEAGCSMTWLTAETCWGDLTNGYTVPRQLGVDRWMGLIAARARTREAVLVVSAGTAMTVDALAPKGEFLGGVIVPGLSLMQQAFAEGVAGVTPESGAWQAFPRCTADAVHSGIVAALCGAIRMQHVQLAAAVNAAPRCLITGGDAACLLPHLGLIAEHVPALVLEGIDQIARGEGKR